MVVVVLTKGGSYKMGTKEQMKTTKNKLFKNPNQESKKYEPPTLERR